MKTRKLRDIEVSAIGMGCMGFSTAYGQAPEENGMMSILSYKSVWLAPGIISSSLLSPFTMIFKAL